MVSTSIITMKRLYFLKLVLIILTTVSLVASFKAIYDDDESTSDILCNNNDFLLYIELLSNPTSCNDIFYGYNNEFIYTEPLISYLASKEKSPPLIMFNIDSLTI